MDPFLQSPGLRQLAHRNGCRALNLLKTPFFKHYVAEFGSPRAGAGDFYVHHFRCRQTSPGSKQLETDRIAKANRVTGRCGR